MANKFGGHVENFYVSYSDMVTLLLILFIYLFSVSEIKPIEYQEGAASMSESITSISKKDATKLGFSDFLNIEVQKLKKMKSQIEKTAVKYGLADKVGVEYKNSQLEVNLGEALLFETGRAELKPASKQVLGVIAASLKQSDAKIVVEGHTDDVPIRVGAFYPSNWELSAARAASVVRYFEEQGVDKASCTVIGYGETKPEVPNTDGAARAKNRRIKILLKPDADKIREQVQANRKSS
jgi:chemotaxis protein MotB